MAKKEISEFEAAHRKRRRKYAARRFFNLITAAVITVVVVFGVYFAAENDLLGFAGDLIASSASGGGSLPAEFSGDSTISMFDWGGSIGILTDTAVYLYSTGGRELLYEQHGMTAPCAEASGRRMLIYDRGGSLLQVRTRTTVLFEQTYDYEIVTASLSEDGYLTVVTGAQRYASQVMVYNPDFSMIFTWSPAEEYVVAAAVGPDERTIAAATVYASGGEIYSTIHLFSVDSSEEKAQCRLEGSAVVGIAFTDRGSVRVICDDQAAEVDTDGRLLGYYGYDGGLTAYLCPPGSGETVLIFDQYTESRSCRLVFLGDEMKENASASAAGRIGACCCDAKRAAVYCSGTLTVFGTDGSMLAYSAAEQDILKVTLVNGGFYAVTRNTLRALKTDAPA